jgi:hypothetical protein
MIKNPATARANKLFQTNIHFDDKNRDKKITLNCKAREEGDIAVACGIFDTNNKLIGSLDINKNNTIDISDLRV